MNSGNNKATIIKCVAAVLCTVMVAYAGISNTNKICENNLAIVSGTASDNVNADASTDDEFDAQFADVDNMTSDASTSDADNADSSSTEDSQSSTSAEDKTATSDKGTAKKKISLTDGLTSTNIDEVLEYYKLVSNKNSKLLFTRSISLVSMDGGKNVSKRMIDIFTPVAQKALAKNTIDDAPFPGKPDKIMASDWQAAKAVNDGTYTTVYVKVVPQTDSYNGSEFEGTCGRTMGVLDGIDRAFEEMEVISADFTNTKMTIKYLDPTVKIKVKNSTGELVKGECEWKYRTYPYIETMDVKFLTVKIHLEGAGGYIDYSVKY